MRHFKPIRAAPRTPPKRRPDGGLGAPAVVRSVAHFLDRQAAREQRTAAEPGTADTGGGGDSGENVAAAAGKRPAEDQPDKRRPPKRRRSLALDDLDSNSNELPVLTAPPPPPREADDESESELDLNSAELLEQQREAERLLALELADRRLAEQLQRELNAAPPVDRSKGSADAYSLRGADAGESSGTSVRQSRQKRPAARGARKRPTASTRRQAGRRDRAQLSIQESLNRSRVTASPEW